MNANSGAEEKHVKQKSTRGPPLEVWRKENEKATPDHAMILILSLNLTNSVFVLYMMEFPTQRLTWKCLSPSPRKFDVTFFNAGLKMIICRNEFYANTWPKWAVHFNSTSIHCSGFSQTETLNNAWYLNVHPNDFERSKDVPVGCIWDHTLSPKSRCLPTLVVWVYYYY